MGSVPLETAKIAVARLRLKPTFSRIPALHWVWVVAPMIQKSRPRGRLW